MHIYPSLISSPLLTLEKTILELAESCDGFHIDIMDGHFVPNITWGPAFVNAIKAITKKPLQVHMMVSNPEQWLRAMQLGQNDSYIFHWEALQNTEKALNLLNEIKNKSVRAGIAINPNTDVQSLVDCTHACDDVLVMSVYPGFSGQIFIPNVLEKIEPLLEIRKVHGHTFAVGLDGGINEENIVQLAAKKVDYIAAATSIFSKNNPREALKKMYQLCNT